MQQDIWTIKEVEWGTESEKVNAHSREDAFIPQGYNVSLVKHPRYFPLFYHEHDFFEITICSVRNLY